MLAASERRLLAANETGTQRKPFPPHVVLISSFESLAANRKTSNNKPSASDVLDAKTTEERHLFCSFL